MGASGLVGGEGGRAGLTVGVGYHRRHGLAAGEAGAGALGGEGKAHRHPRQRLTRAVQHLHHHGRAEGGADLGRLGGARNHAQRRGRVDHAAAAVGQCEAHRGQVFCLGRDGIAAYRGVGGQDRAAGQTLGVGRDPGIRRSTREASAGTAGRRSKAHRDPGHRLAVGVFHAHDEQVGERRGDHSGLTSARHRHQLGWLWSC